MVPAYCGLFRLIPACCCLLRLITAYYGLLRLIATYCGFLRLIASRCWPGVWDYESQEAVLQPPAAKAQRAAMRAG